VWRIGKLPIEQAAVRVGRSPKVFLYDSLWCARLQKGLLEDYIKFAGLKFKRKTIGAPAFTGKELLKHVNCVIGCGRDPKDPPTSDGLRHWIYVNSQGILQNWGKKYDLKRVALPTMNYQYIPYVVELK